MNHKEIMQLIKDLRKQFKAQYKNKSDDEIDKMILDMFFKAFCDGNISASDLETFANAMGYELNPEFVKELKKQAKKNKK